MNVTSSVFKTVGLAFVITNYLKGFFFALFPDFSIDVRRVLSISKSGKIIEKISSLRREAFLRMKNRVLTRQTPEIILFRILKSV